VGSYSVDFDAARSIELWMVEEGQVIVTYDTINDGRAIDVEYVGFKPDDDDYQDLVDGLYSYHNRADDSGEFTFDVLADMHYEQYHGEQYDQREHFWFNTRWYGDGRGRSDVLVTDGDLPDIEVGGSTIASYVLAECWGNDFLRDYWLEMVVLANGNEETIEEQGIESDCSFDQQLPEVK